MKRFLLFPLLFFFSMSGSKAQESVVYHPLTKEGKVWNFLSEPICYDQRVYYSYVVKGDTLIGDKDYKKLYFRHQSITIYTAALRDEGSRVYIIPYDSTREFVYYDLQSEELLEMPFGDYAKPSLSGSRAPDTINSHGLLLKRVYWTIHPVFTHNWYTWIEGVGCTEDFFKSLFLKSSHEDRVLSSGGWGTLVSCYEDGVCIYGNENADIDNHLRPVSLKYEAKEGLEHSPSDIKAEVRQNLILFYFNGLKDRFVFSEEDWGIMHSNVVGTMFLTSSLVDDGYLKRYPDSKLSFRIESDYEIFTIDISTAIHDLAAPEMVNGTSSDGQWYDLSGRRVSVSSASSVPSVLPKGVYIKDGRKVMVK